MNIEQIKRKISKIKIEKLSKTSGFQKRKPRKLELIGLLSSFWLMITMGQNSLPCWCRCLHQISHVFLSKQGLSKRLNKATSLGQDFLQLVLSQSLHKDLKEKTKSKLFAFFTNVYIEDSTCVSLPAMLHSVFPGPHNRYGKSATARIQVRINLLKDLCTHIAVQSFRHSDGKYAGEILSILKPKDLVIRDLGYWSLNVFKQIAAQEAFFLSRLKTGLLVFDSQGAPIELLAHLKKAYQNGQSIIDLQVLIGRQQIAGRLIAIKAPQSVVLLRKRKAKKNRDQRVNYKKEYYDLLEWTILFTNVEKKVWEPRQVLEAYGFRWRIEMIFKCWKSKFKLEKLFRIHQSLNPNRARLTIYLFLAMITLFYTRWYSFFVFKVYEQTGRLVSPFKFADFVKEHFWELLDKQQCLEQFIPRVSYFATYEVRNRPSHLHLLLNPLS